MILRPLNKTRSPKTLRRLKPSKRGLDTPFTGELENQSPSRRVFDGSYNADTEGGRDCSNLVEEISGNVDKIRLRSLRFYPKMSLVVGNKAL